VSESPTPGLAGEYGLQGVCLWWNRPLIEGEPERPVSREGIAGNEEDGYEIEVVQLGVFEVAILNLPLDQRLAREVGRVSAEVAGARDLAAADLHHVTGEAPGGARARCTFQARECGARAVRIDRAGKPGDDTAATGIRQRGAASGASGEVT